MNRSKMIRVADIQPILSLVADLADDSPGQRIIHLLEGMRRIFNARVSSAGVAEKGNDDKLRCVNVLDSGWEDCDRRKILAMIYDPRGSQYPLAPYVITKIAEQSEPRFSFDRRVMFSDREWYTTPATMDFCQTVDVDEGLYAMSLIPGTWRVAGLSLLRPWGDRRPFSARDRQMLALLLQATQSLLVNHPPKLPRRLQQVLDLLLTGRSVKQVAGELQISVYTAEEHVSNLYRRFNVAGRHELMARFVR